MPELPSGTVTFLFTDIERSTESAAALGDERWAEALEAHRSLLRPAFSKYSGVEVGTESDAFFVAFARALDAVNAAVEGQRALESHAWPGETRLRVRMGMHTGEALVRSEDYVGHAVHKAKRVSDAGHGGQIVLSQTTADLVGDGVALRDLGPHRLKDLGEPQQLFQVEADDLPHQFPMLRSLEAFKHNLPAQRSSFIGRERELGDVRALLDEHRLVTLTGIGGCGKTRLAVQVGAEVLDDFPDGVFFVDLSPVGDGSLVATTVVEIVGAAASASPGSPSAPIDLIVRHLSARTCLLLLDNCEHLIDDCAELVDRILTGCPNVHILATSRESLDVDGEQSWRVPSMAMSEEDAASSEAVSLFKARAQTVEAAFELTPENIAAVTEVCRRLDGIPLAIEFAAARVAHLSPGQIAERLDDMFKLLTGGRRRVQRQQTLQAALDWSYELLSPDEQRFLRTLAVFSGGFTLAAAEGVYGDDVVELMGSLVSKSLVSTEPRGGKIRYRLLETVRLYAEEKLRESGEADELRTRHRDWFQNQIASLELTDCYLDMQTVAELGTEIGNYRAALSWSLAQNRRDLLASMVARLGSYWANSSAYEEGHHWATVVADEPEGVATDDYVECLALLAYLSMIRLDGRTLEHARRAVEIADGRISPGLLIATSMVAFNLAILAAATSSEEGAAEARSWGDRATAMGRDAGPEFESWVLFYRASIELMLADMGAAVDSLERAIVLTKQARHSLFRTPRYIAGYYGLISLAHHLLGHTDAAVTAAEQSLALAASVDEWNDGGLLLNPITTQYTHGSAAMAFAAAGDTGRARSNLRINLAIARDTPAPLMINDAFIVCGAVASLEGDAPRAARLMAAARHAGGAGTFAGPAFRTPAGAAVYRHYLPRVRAALSGDDARQLRDEGKAMSIDEAVAYALKGLEEK